MKKNSKNFQKVLDKLKMMCYNKENGNTERKLLKTEGNKTL